MSHEKTHLKEMKKSKLENGETVRKDTHQSAVQQHGNVDGPPCFICGIDQSEAIIVFVNQIEKVLFVLTNHVAGAICKDAANYKNHVLSHYYRNFDEHVPAKKPYNCPVCQKESRDKITLIR